MTAERSELELVKSEPAVPDETAEASEQFVRWLRAGLLELDKRRADLAEEGDVEALAFGLVGLQRIAADLKTLTRSIENDLVRILPTPRVVIDGLGIVERHRTADRKGWKSAELLAHVLRVAVDPDETGELPPAGELLERIRSTLTKTVPFTASLSWRVTALRELGVDPDEWSETTYGRSTVQIIDTRKKGASS